MRGSTRTHKDPVPGWFLHSSFIDVCRVQSSHSSVTTRHLPVNADTACVQGYGHTWNAAVALEDGRLGRTIQASLKHQIDGYACVSA